MLQTCLVLAVLEKWHSSLHFPSKIMSDISCYNLCGMRIFCLSKMLMVLFFSMRSLLDPAKLSPHLFILSRWQSPLLLQFKTAILTSAAVLKIAVCFRLCCKWSRENLFCLHFLIWERVYYVFFLRNPNSLGSKLSLLLISGSNEYKS